MRAPFFSVVIPVYNRAAERSISAQDISKRLVISSAYDLPFGRGRHFLAGIPRYADFAIGGWQVAGISSFKDGFPLSITNATNNTNSFGGAQRPNIVGNVR